MKRLVLVLAAVFGLSGCCSITDWCGWPGDDTPSGGTSGSW